MIPETRYAKTSDGVHIAYQEFGEGPTDLVLVMGWVFNVEQAWEWAPVAGFLRRLASFSRVMVFDRRGTGLSDHVVEREDQLTLETRMDDIRTVMDAAGSDRATLLGTDDGAMQITLFAATYPERTSALILWAATARGLWAPDYPWAMTASEWDAYLARINESWGTHAFAEWMVAWEWPDLHDPEFERAYATWMRRSVGPGDASALERMFRDTDVRDLLPAVQAPTLVVHRTGDQVEPVAQARYLAERIVGASLVELPGSSHGWMGPDQGELLDVVENFMNELRREEAAFDRVLATVLFTDIVRSTERTMELGDVSWKQLLERHHARIRRLLARYRGQEIDTAGDGFFASFDGPARAIRCAQAATRAVNDLGIEIRAGLHTGECELIDGKVGGIAVNIGARVAHLAQPGEVLVSSTVKDLVAGSGLRFDDRGMHKLKGIPDTWHIFAAQD